MQVTDDLFDEIAQEVMDDDEQRLLEGLSFSFGCIILGCILVLSCICLSVRQILPIGAWH